MIAKHCSNCAFGELIGDAGKVDLYTCLNDASGHKGHVLLDTHVCDFWQDKWITIRGKPSDKAMLVDGEKDGDTLFKR